MIANHLYKAICQMSFSFTHFSLASSDIVRPICQADILGLVSSEKFYPKLLLAVI